MINTNTDADNLSHKVGGMIHNDDKIDTNLQLEIQYQNTHKDLIIEPEGKHGYLSDENHS